MCGTISRVAVASGGVAKNGPKSSPSATTFTVCAAVPVTDPTKFPAGTGFVRHEFQFEGKPRTLWVFLPRNYSPDRKFPAIVFLHGLFEAGDGEACLTGGLGPVIC